MSASTPSSNLFTIQPYGKSYDDALIAAVPAGGGEPRTVIEADRFRSMRSQGN